MTMNSTFARLRTLLLESVPTLLYKTCSRNQRNPRASWLPDASSLTNSHKTPYVLYPRVTITTLALSPSLSDIVVMIKVLMETIRLRDCLLLFLAGWVMVPACRSLYKQCAAVKCRYRRHDLRDACESDDDEYMNDCSSTSKSYKTTSNTTTPAWIFEDSYLFQLVDHVSQVARLSSMVFCTDLLFKILVGLGFCRNMENLSFGFAKILYIAWAAQRLAVLKRYVLNQVVMMSSDEPTNGSVKMNRPLPPAGQASLQQQPLLLRGQTSVVDRLLDGIIFLCTIMLLLDILDVEMGVGVTSMFAFGSAGTLIIGLASRDLASMLVNGLALSTTNRFVQGEHVKFGDGTVGAVHKIGWMQTTIRNYDNLLEVVPNNELGMQRVRNVSRCTVCQIQQTLRFHYDDAEKLPQCLDDIMQEIKLSCKDVITDGSKPFRATWRHFRATHLEIVVDTHHYGKPIGKKYWEDLQQVNLAIYRAVKRNGVRFVTEWSPFNETNCKKR
ncbi:hypothetical protein MPSEU_000351200 [Mayamaea pseudoterrestris]|nr:hypothetical protein MPSEU_000351200 [Mayamaea pseudoterrestris]